MVAEDTFTVELAYQVESGRMWLHGEVVLFVAAENVVVDDTIFHAVSFDSQDRRGDVHQLRYPITLQ